MWAIDNRTPFKAAKAWSRNRDGVHEWLVALKAVFDIRDDGSLRIADEQMAPLQLPEYNGEPGASSLKYDADVIAPKPSTDVLVNGSAHAPDGRPSTDFVVTMRVASIEKSLRVRGSRQWEDGAFGLSASDMQPVTSVPLVYEHAYGGFDRSHPDPARQRLDLRNPVGCGLVPREGDLLPCIEYPSGSLEKNGPAGFGAIDSFWSPRRQWVGTYDEHWQRERFPLPPLDWDPRALLCAPLDQLPSTALRGGELIELTNLTPDGLLRFTLPRIYWRFRTRIDGRLEDHPAHLGTVIIEPDQRRVILVWQSALVVHANGDYLEHTIISEKARLR
jgi:hypothetical protein